jgi:hypothetical protein
VRGEEIRHCKLRDKRARGQKFIYAADRMNQKGMVRQLECE